MPQTFSNTLTNPMTINPAAAALTNKINPSPLSSPPSFRLPSSPIVGQPSSIQFSTPTSDTGTRNMLGNIIPGGTGVPAGNGLLGGTPLASPETTSTTRTGGGGGSSPTASLSTSSGANNSPAQPTPPLYDPKTGEMTDYGKSQQPPPITPSAYPGLIAEGVSEGQKAAQLKQEMQTSENEIAGNPNYSLDTQVGRQGLIEKNIGAEQQGLAQESAAAFAGANATAPVQVSPGNTLVAPDTATPEYGLGTGAGGNGSGAYQNFSNLQFNTAQGQTLSTQANTLTTAANQTDQNFKTLSDATAGLNLSDYPTLNSLSQALQKQAGGAGKVAALNEAYNALTTSLGAIIGSNSDVLTPTLISHLIGSQSINTLSPAQLETLYQTVQKTMATKIQTVQQQALQAEKSGQNFNNGNATASTNGNTVNINGATLVQDPTTGMWGKAPTQ